MPLPNPTPPPLHTHTHTHRQGENTSRSFVNDQKEILAGFLHVFTRWHADPFHYKPLRLRSFKPSTSAVIAMIAL